MGCSSSTAKNAGNKTQDMGGASSTGSTVETSAAPATSGEATLLVSSPQAAKKGMQAETETWISLLHREASSHLTSSLLRQGAAFAASTQTADAGEAGGNSSSSAVRETTSAGAAEGNDKSSSSLPAPSSPCDPTETIADTAAAADGNSSPCLAVPPEAPHPEAAAIAGESLDTIAFASPTALSECPAETSQAPPSADTCPMPLAAASGASLGKRFEASAEDAAGDVVAACEELTSQKAQEQTQISGEGTFGSIFGVCCRPCVNA
eukprot:TRINITY_DN7391_c0_g1_i2.p1 TRINITY_DN7391_c0_g1~~TRINITY_DN7391_c0_g1_i2.p1  ORF type:complete len:265 (-),score=57.95 TRINITY_DN7391_c0_g1_i2:132-926(-)